MSINAKLYVTFREEDARLWDSITESWKENAAPGRLGYAAAYKPGDDKIDKKNAAQFEWARYTLDEFGNFEYRTNHRHVWPDGKAYDWNVKRPEFTDDYGRYKLTQIYDASPLKESLKPIIIENVPRNGFKVASTVSRYSTSNKLWRIMDPLGFELEISTANMEDLIMTGVINCGEFEGLLIWDFGKNGIGKATLKRA